MKFSRGTLYKLRAEVMGGKLLDRAQQEALLEAMTEAVELPASINTNTAHALYKWRLKWA